MQNSIGHIKYVLLIGRDVSRGKHHVMKSSRRQAFSLLSVPRVKGRNTLIARREGEGLESRLLKSMPGSTTRYTTESAMFVY